MDSTANKKFYSVVVLALIGAIIATSLLVAFNIFVQKPPLHNSGATISSGEAMVVLDYGNGKVRKFKGPAGENANVWDLFQQVAAIGKISVEASGRFFPEKIDGLANGTSGMRWHIYLNNVRQSFSPIDIKAKPGDEILFKFE